MNQTFISSSILFLPEILDQIFSYLNFSSIKCSRIVCKSWKNEIDRWWWKNVILIVNKENFSIVEKFINVPTIDLAASRGFPPIRRIFYTMFNSCVNLEELRLYNVDLFIDPINDVVRFKELLIEFILRLKVVKITRSFSHILPDIYKRIGNSPTNLKKMRLTGMSHTKIPVKHLIKSINKITRIELFQSLFKESQILSLKSLAFYVKNKPIRCQADFIFDQTKKINHQEGYH